MMKKIGIMIVIVTIITITSIFVLVFLNRPTRIDIEESEDRFATIHSKIQEILNSYNIYLVETTWKQLFNHREGFYTRTYRGEINEYRFLQIHLTNNVGVESFDLSITHRLGREINDVQIDIEDHPYFFEISRLLSGSEINRKEHNEKIMSIYDEFEGDESWHDVRIPINFWEHWVYLSEMQILGDTYISRIVFTGRLNVDI
jgi:hypothetical protein